MINRLVHCLFLICSQVRLRPTRVKQMSGEEAVTDAHGSAAIKGSNNKYLPAADQMPRAT